MFEKKRFFRQFKNKNIHIVGVSGAEGSAIVEFFFDLGIRNVTCHDFCQEKEFRKSFWSFHDWMSLKEKRQAFSKLKKLPFLFNFKDDYLAGIEQADIIFVPQSWERYEFNKPLKKLRKNKKFSSLTSLYFNICSCPIIATTGTSGKSTTARLIFEILKAAEGKQQRFRRVYFSGNDRENLQILNQIFEIKFNDVLVLEVSNRQLKMDLGKSPHIGIITNISPNHLDDHKDFAEYVKVKQSLLSYQKKDDFAVLNADNIQTRSLSRRSKGRTCLFSIKKELEEGAFLRKNDLIVRYGGHEHKICSRFDLKIPGPHNIENALAASLACFLFGINTKYIREAIINFSGLKHRLEFVIEKKGVKYYNDSSACNPDGPRVACQSFSSPLYLILGGSRKKIAPHDFDAMAEAIIKSRTKAVFLIGQIRDIIKKELIIASAKFKKPCPFVCLCENLEEAVRRIYKSARPGDCVVLTPGAESFGEFRDYRHRGNKFKRLVKKL